MPGTIQNAGLGWHSYQIHAWNGSQDVYYTWTGGWDDQAPTLTPSIPTTSTWLKPSQQISWTADDGADRSGLQKVTIQWDGGGESGAVSSPQAIPAGVHTAVLRAYDNVGNVTTANLGPFWVDDGAPGVNFSLNPAAPDGANGWYITPPAFTLTATDAASDVSTRQYSLDGAARTDYTGPVTIATDGAHALQGFATDNAGNEGSTTVLPVKVDTTPPSAPIITVNATSASLTVLTASWTADDPTSGIGGYAYAIGTTAGGADILPRTATDKPFAYAANLTLSAGARYYFTVWAINGAGLENSAASSGITVSAGGCDGVFTAGGGTRTDGSLTLTDALGQFVVGTSTDGATTALHGLLAAQASPICKPDAMIQGPADAAAIGRHAYGDGQTSAATTSGTTAEKAVYTVLLGNDGNAPDDLILSGPAGANGWSVRYYAPTVAGDVEITPAVTTGGWTAHNIDLLTPATVRVEVSADKSVKGGAVYAATLAVTSGGDATAGDFVVAQTTKSALRKVNLTADIASPVLVGQAVTFTATTEGGGTPEFKFRTGVIAADGTITYDPMPPAYTTNNVYTWTPATDGRFIIDAYAREQGTTLLKWASLTYTVKKPLSAVAMTVSLPSPQPWDQPVTVTAIATGGAKLEYAFKATYWDANNVQQWILLRDYGPSATWTGVIEKGAARINSICVYAREQGTTKYFYAWQTYTTKPPCTALALAVTQTSPQPWDQALTLTATPTGGAQLEYQFKATYLDTTGTLVKLVLRDYSASVTWTGTLPQGTLPQGTARTYTLYAYAREKGTTVAYLQSAYKDFKITPPLTALAMTATPATPGVLGASLTVKGTPTGGAKLEYQFKATYLDAGGALVKLLLQDYGPSPTWTGTLPTDIPRTYTLYLYAREQGTTVLFLKSWALTYVTQIPLTALGMSVTPASPQPKATMLTVKALPTGGNKLEFAFKATYTDATGALVKLTLQDYSASATWTGQLPQDAARAYTLYVYAREQGTTVTYLKSVTQAFTTK